MLKNKVRVIFSIVIGLLGIAGIMFSGSQKIFADKKPQPDSDNTVHPTCYSMPAEPFIILQEPHSVEDKEALEALYKEGKINKETYEARKAKIEEQIRRSNQKDKQDNQ